MINSGLLNLEVLNLQKCKSLTSFDGAALSNLEYLELRDTGIKNFDGAGLSKLKELQLPGVTEDFWRIWKMILVNLKSYWLAIFAF